MRRLRRWCGGFSRRRQDFARIERFQVGGDAHAIQTAGIRPGAILPAKLKRGQVGHNRREGLRADVVAGLSIRPASGGQRHAIIDPIDTGIGRQVIGQRAAIPGQYHVMIVMGRGGGVLAQAERQHRAETIAPVAQPLRWRIEVPRHPCRPIHRTDETGGVMGGRFGITGGRPAFGGCCEVAQIAHGGDRNAAFHQADRHRDHLRRGIRFRIKRDASRFVVRVQRHFGARASRDDLGHVLRGDLGLPLHHVDLQRLARLRSQISGGTKRDIHAIDGKGDALCAGWGLDQQAAFRGFAAGCIGHAGFKVEGLHGIAVEGGLTHGHITKEQKCDILPWHGVHHIDLCPEQSHAPRSRRFHTAELQLGHIPQGEPVARLLERDRLGVIAQGDIQPQVTVTDLIRAGALTAVIDHGQGLIDNGRTLPGQIRRAHNVFHRGLVAGLCRFFPAATGRHHHTSQKQTGDPPIQFLHTK